VAVGQTGEAAERHTQRKVEPLDIRGAYLVLITTAEQRQLLSAYRLWGQLKGTRVIESFPFILTIRIFCGHHLPSADPDDFAATLYGHGVSARKLKVRQ